MTTSKVSSLEFRGIRFRHATPEFIASFTTFFDTLERQVNEHYTSTLMTESPTLKVEDGYKYLKLSANDTVIAFISKKQNGTVIPGDVFYPQSELAPYTISVQGNIFTENHGFVFDDNGIHVSLPQKKRGVMSPHRNEPIQDVNAPTNGENA